MYCNISDIIKDDPSKVCLQVKCNKLCHLRWKKNITLSLTYLKLSEKKKKYKIDY